MLCRALLWSGHICTSFMDRATWAELWSVWLWSCSQPILWLLGCLAAISNSEQEVQLCQADACMVLNGFDEWGCGSFFSVFYLAKSNYNFPLLILVPELKVVMALPVHGHWAWAVFRVSYCRFLLYCGWTSLPYSEGFQSKMSENSRKRGVSGIGPMCFRRGSNSFLK